MANGNGSKFYFKVEDLKALLESGATHVVISAEAGSIGGHSRISAEAFDATASSKGITLGCPWPCGGRGTTISKQSLEQAQKMLGSS